MFKKQDRSVTEALQAERAAAAAVDNGVRGLVLSIFV